MLLRIPPSTFLQLSNLCYHSHPPPPPSLPPPYLLSVMRKKSMAWPPGLVDTLTF